MKYRESLPLLHAFILPFVSCRTITQRPSLSDQVATKYRDPYPFAQYYSNSEAMQAVMAKNDDSSSGSGRRDKGKGRGSVAVVEGEEQLQGSSATVSTTSRRGSSGMVNGEGHAGNTVSRRAPNGSASTSPSVSPTTSTAPNTSSSSGGGVNGVHPSSSKMQKSASSSSSRGEKAVSSIMIPNHPLLPTQATQQPQYHQSSYTSNLMQHSQGYPYNSSNVPNGNGMDASAASISASASSSPSNNASSSSSYPSSQRYPHSPSSNNPSIRLPRPSEAFTRDLSHVLQHTFIPSILPTPEEYQIKENARKFLEGLAERITPGAKLLPFGSQANGMALKNSDMDLCYISPPNLPSRLPSELVDVLGRLIQAEAPDFQVKMLPRARIPIIKLNMPPNASNPYGMSCDIGFENRLALENTRLLLTYAMADPRLRTLVLFLKVWCKRRKINNPYLGTLSSYGYVLLAIHFLINVRQPPVLPNLQRLHPPKPMQMGQTEFEGRDIYFFDDLELLPRYWQSTNRDSVGELLISFFQYYFKEFKYSFEIISIRSDGGLLSKASKGWQQDEVIEEYVNAPRNLNRLCIEDPFQTDYNVARTVTVDGLFTIRGEIARACQILRSGARSDVNAIIAELVEEREDYLVQAPPPSSTNRRRSAPSPRLQPNVLATQKDFQTWAMANGVPHASGGQVPIYSHNLQPNPLASSQVQASGVTGPTNAEDPAATASSSTQPLANNPNAEALARYQQASQALSQANLQQQQAQQQQQILATLQASLAATNLRNNYRQQQQQQQPPRRFQQQENSYRNNYRQQQGGGYQGQQSYPQSPTMSNSAHLLHPSSHHGSLSRSTNADGYQRPPLLDRRSSWDGSNSDRDMRQSYRGTSSVSEAGASSVPASPITSNSGNLPSLHGPGSRFVPSPASNASSPSATSSLGTYVGNDSRQGRDPRASTSGYGRPVQQNGGYSGRNPNFINNRPPRAQYQQQQQQQGGQEEPYSPTAGYAMAPYPTGMPVPITIQQAQMYMGPSPQAMPSATIPMQLPTSPMQSQNPPLQQYGPRHAHRSESISTVSHAASDVSGSARTSPQHSRNSSLVQDLLPSLPYQPHQPATRSPQTVNPIRFGNFDAAFYDSEPTDMASLGLFDGIPGVDSPIPSTSASPAQRRSDSKLQEGMVVPEDLPQLPPPAPTPSSSANTARAASKFRPQLADIPASPAANRAIPGTSQGTPRRPSHNRRKSAGDEKSLGLEDITFFGKIPVNKDEAEREKAMAALLKESSRDFKSSSVPSNQSSQAGSLRGRGKPRTASTSSSTTTNDSASLPRLSNAPPGSSSASITSASTSPSEAFRSDSPPPPLPNMDIHHSPSETRSTPTPTASASSSARQNRFRAPSSPRLPPTPTTAAKADPQRSGTGGLRIRDAGTPTKSTTPSYAALVATTPISRSTSEKPRRRTGSTNI